MSRRKQAVVIGVGFGGMSASAYLAKAGWDVRVVDKIITQSNDQQCFIIG